MNLTCTSDTFCGGETADVRWLDWDADFERARRFWPAGQPLTRGDWDEARAAGYRYAAIVEHGEIVATAAEYRFSDSAWMLAAVRTAESHRRRGYGRRVAAFVTAHILAAGRLATCQTRPDNLAMIRTAHAIGFRPAPQS